jgi:carbon-monoxide dehydrogenase medium subunit
VKPAPFSYHRPETVAEALALLAEHADEAKVLAGGQSLVPTMNFRLARPAQLIDVNRLASLAYVNAPADGTLAIGALTRQRVVERSALVAQASPLLAEGVSLIGHVQIRTRGTIGGSLAHADPAAELPAIVAALDGSLRLARASGERVVPASEFFVDYLTTALEPDELLTEVQLPALPPRTGTAFVELSRRYGDFALVGVAAVVTLDANDRCTRARLAVVGVGATPVRPTQAEQSLAGTTLDAAALKEAGRLVSEVVEPESDVHAPAEYRKHLAGVLVAQALARAAERARATREVE